MVQCWNIMIKKCNLEKKTILIKFFFLFNSEIMLGNKNEYKKNLFPWEIFENKEAKKGIYYSFILLFFLIFANYE